MLVCTPAWGSFFAFFSEAPMGVYTAASKSLGIPHKLLLCKLGMYTKMGLNRPRTPESAEDRLTVLQINGNIYA